MKNFDARLKRIESRVTETKPDGGDPVRAFWIALRTLGLEELRAYDGPVPEGLEAELQERIEMLEAL